MEEKKTPPRSSVLIQIDLYTQLKKKEHYSSKSQLQIPAAEGVQAGLTRSLRRPRTAGLA
jgi:hypothetical protein